MSLLVNGPSHSRNKTNPAHILEKKWRRREPLPVPCVSPTLPRVKPDERHHKRRKPQNRVLGHPKTEQGYVNRRLELAENFAGQQS